ncbi:MAG: fibronectin type III domain-containing protein [Bacteroidetes bacterium]|nr:fibronectin type III domain-containing protein [Bacteroidota bacterium]
MQKTLSVIAVTLILFLLTNEICFSQGTFRDSIWYANFVKHSDGSLCTHTAPTATFVCFLNRDQSKILTENAARWSLSPDPNIDGKGVFGVELGNFVNPSLKAGDSVFVRFTCSARGEQEVLSDEVSSIPPVRFPLFLNLAKKNIPQQPQNLTLSFSPEKHRVLQWDSIAGVTYTVYRRNFSDTLSNGKSRGLYERLAVNLTTTSYVDSFPFASYYHGYIVFAISSGGVYSAASSEVTEPDTTRFQLSAVPSATTVTLAWSPIPDSNRVVKGYNIYRRTENSTYGQPIGYSGLDTTFIVSRLPLGTKFFYKVKGRIDAAKELGESNEIAATTMTSREGFYSYANLKVAVVIYINTNRGSISDAEVVKIRKMLEVGRLFYWRNSLMKLNTPFTYYLIDTYKDFPSRDDYAVSRTANDLQALGVMNTQYDIVFRISPATSGYWSFGVMNLNLPGPARSTGFSHSEWPRRDRCSVSRLSIRH